jgi:PAS domain S-box-containing protein
LCLRRKDGQPVWVLENATLAASGPDCEDVIEGTLIDITERKQVERALKQSELRYRTLIERMNEGVTYVDNDDVVLYANQQFSEMTGYSREELAGRVASELVLTDEDKQLVAQKNRLRLRGIADQYEVRLRKRSGDAMWVQVSGAPIFDANGTPIGSVGIHTDITARKRAEEALSAEKERLAVTLASIGDGVIATDTGGRIVLMNNVAEKLTGWGPEEAQGRQLGEVLHAIDEKTRESLPNPVESALRAGQAVVRARQAVLISRDCNERIIADSAAPIRDVDGKTIGVVLVIRDITEKRKMEEELRKTGKLESLGVLAGGIAHDFNNLLTGIVGNISLAKLRARPDDGVYHRLTEAEHACFRAKDLTQQLLTFSKGGAPVMRTASIGELLRESASFAITGSNSRCLFDVADDLWPVEVDEGQMSQVVHNLALNAQQSMPDGGVMMISARNVSLSPDPAKNSIPLAAGRYIVVSVIDRGIGIPEEHIEKIFDPYFTTKHKGSGLGLATCYSIVKNHGGYVGVVSKFGAGTTFSVYLPASDKPVVRPLADRQSLPSGTGRILLMDDEETIRTVTGDILVQLGYEVSVVRDGAEAVDLYSNAMLVGRPFDAVILDLTIPGGIGGKEAIAKLREIDPSVRAIVSSGYSNDPIMADFRAYGFSGVAAKPYRVEDLRQILDEVMLDAGR